jgi:hypothetical protein
MKHLLLAVMLMTFADASAQQSTSHDVNWLHKPQEKKFDLLYKGRLLTAFRYADDVAKPILYPIRTMSGIEITRGFPIAPRAGERTDHPHQVGLWMNYESVNGLDFWNNSYAISPDKADNYGSIKFAGKNFQLGWTSNSASLEIVSSWNDKGNREILNELTTLTIRVQNDNTYFIDRRSALLAVADTVTFLDVKDGLLGLRVARELEMPSTQQDKFVDASGNITTVPQLNNKGVTGNYTNAEGLQGDDVWGKRSRWVMLNGEKEGKAITIGIIDHPHNVGYPTYWHARGYGLFAANPLGQKVFSNGKEALNLTLTKGQNKVFLYRIVIHEGSFLTPDQMNEYAKDFSISFD